jgi:Leucine-rich repeat (LRR) protein
MNWNNYLLDQKSPFGHYAHLGVLEGRVSAPFDLSELPEDTRILDLSTPLKKFKLKYTNLAALIGNKKIEAITLNDIDEERLSVFSTMPNLKYLKISNNKQPEIPDLSELKSVEVLLLASIKSVQHIDFLKNMKSLKTLYIYGINHLYDITPIANLTNLQELCIDHGKLSGTGKSIKSIEPLQELYELKYLCLSIAIEAGTVDFSSLYGLKKLQKLTLLPRYLKDAPMDILKKELPLVTNL